MTGDETSGFDCVVDASVGIKLFLIEPLTDRADALFVHLTDDPPARLYVPDLFFVECANILCKYVRRFGYTAEAAVRDVRDLRSEIRYGQTLDIRPYTISAQSGDSSTALGMTDHREPE